MKRYDKVIAVNIDTNQPRPDLGKPGQPRIFTVEIISGNSVKLFNVGESNHALWFNMTTGLPILDTFSKKSQCYKYWKDYKIL